MPLLLDIALKGGLVVVLAALGARLLRGRSASTRYTVWSTAMLCLLALPALAAVLPAWHSGWLPGVPENWLRGEIVQTDPGSEPSYQQANVAMFVRPTPRAPAFAPVLEQAGQAIRAEQTDSAFPADKADNQATPSLQRALPGVDSVPTWLALFAGIYFLGVVVFLSRLAAGYWGVWRIVRRAGSVRDESVRADFDHTLLQLGIERPVTLLETDDTTVPVAWEVTEPVVLLPRSARGWPRERLRIALLHELAHVQRRDCQLQFLAGAALALHWFNPVAWWAARRLRIEREHACDDAVLQLGTRASDYADHLLQVARGLLPQRGPHWATVPMARSSHLEGRVTAILDPKNPHSLPERRTTMSVFVAALVLLLPLASLQPGAQAQSRGSSGATRHVVSHEHQTTHVQQSTHVNESTHVHLEDADSMFPHGLVEAIADAVHAGAGAVHAAVGLSPASSAAGTPATVATTGGAQAGEPTVDQLVQMRIHGVSPEFIEGVRDAFGRDVSVRELIQMRIHGATPELVEELRELLPNEQWDLGDVVQMRIHGAGPEFIRDMQGMFDDLTARDIVQFRIHGVSVDYIRGMQDELAGDVSMRELVQMRIHGASVDYVRTMTDLLDGEELNARDIQQMRIHGVSVELVRELQDDGYNDLTAGDLVQMKIHGFDRWLRRRGGR